MIDLPDLTAEEVEVPEGRFRLDRAASGPPSTRCLYSMSGSPAQPGSAWGRPGRPTDARHHRLAAHQARAGGSIKDSPEPLAKLAPVLQAANVRCQIP
jgi:hypothetical protein